MPTFYRLIFILVLAISVIITAGCQVNTSPTSIPANNIPVSATSSPISTTPTDPPVAPEPSAVSNEDLKRTAITFSNVGRIEALASLPGHNNRVTGLVYQPDITHLAT